MVFVGSFLPEIYSARCSLVVLHMERSAFPVVGGPSAEVRLQGRKSEVGTMDDELGVTLWLCQKP